MVSSQFWEKSNELYKTDKIFKTNKAKIGQESCIAKNAYKTFKKLKTNSES